MADMLVYLSVTDMDIATALRRKIDSKTKPLGALGILEKIAFQVGYIQQTLTPQLNRPELIVFAGDHGLAQNGVSAYPQEVTGQMVMNFLRGGAAINVFCRQHGIGLKIVDAGVAMDFTGSWRPVHAKVGYGTRNCIDQAAMTVEELQQCLQYGRESVRECVAKGSNVVGFGEMGIGNTSSAALIMSALTGIGIEACVGRGTGVNDEQLRNKVAVLQKIMAFHGTIHDPMKVLQTYGGFEIAQMCGAMLEAYEQNMLILVDGFIATTAFLVAGKLSADIRSNAVFCHRSDEKGHHLLLEYLSAEPLLNLGMRLGEGTGCAVAYPLIESAVRFLNEMASFESAGVSNI